MIKKFNDFVNESGKDLELSELEVGMNIKVETHAGFYKNAKITRIIKDMISYDGDAGAGSLKYGSPKLSLPTK